MEKYFTTQHHAGLLAHNDFQAQARVSSQGKIKKVQMAENISPKNHLKRPLPCAPCAQPSNSTTQTVPNRMSLNLSTHAAFLLSHEQRNLAFLSAANTESPHNLSSSRVNGLSSVLWSLQVALLTPPYLHFRSGSCLLPTPWTWHFRAYFPGMPPLSGLSSSFPHGHGYGAVPRGLRPG